MIHLNFITFRLAVITLCVVWFLTGCAGPPGLPSSQRATFSNDTRTTAPGTVEIEAGATVDPGDRFQLPVTAKIGVTESSEIFIEWSPYNWEDRSNQSDGEGVGDTTIGVRERILDFGREDPAVAYQFKTKIPTASAREGLGTEEMEFFAALIFEMPTEKTSLVGMYQLGLLGESGDGDPDVQHGLAVSGRMPLTGAMGAYGELAAIFTPEQDQEELLATGGLTFPVIDGWVFDAGLAIGLTEDAPDLQFLFGFAVNLGGIGAQ